MVGLNLKPPAYSEEEDQDRHCCLDRPRSKSPERGCRDHGDDGGGGYHIPLPLHSNGAPLGQGKALGLQDALNVLGHLENTIRLQKFLINHSPILMIMIVKIIIIIMIVSRS